MGPRARDVLAAVTDADVSNAASRSAMSRAIDDRRRAGAGAARHLCRRARLGAAYSRSSSPLTVYDALMAAGETHGIANAGYRAIESLRLEKGYRAWGADIGPDHTPLEAGLGWAVKLKSNTPFLGRDALEAQAAKPLPRLLAGFTADQQYLQCNEVQT